MNAIIYLLVALGSFLLVLQHRRSFKLYTATGSFVLMCLVASVGFGSFGLHLIWASTIFHLVYPMMAALLPAALLGFLVRWLEIKEHKADNYLWGLGVSVGVLHLILKQSLDAQDTSIGIPEYLIATWFLGSSTFGLSWLWQLFAESGDTQRVRLQQLIGLIMVAVLSLLLEGLLRLTMPDLQLNDISALQQIATLQGPIPPLGAVLSMLTLYVLHLNVRRTRMISLQEFFSRLIAHGVTAFIFTLVVALSLFLGGRYSLHTGFQVWLISLLFVILLPNLHWSIRQVSDHVLNQSGSDLDVLVDELEQALRHVVNELDFAHTLINKIHASGRVQWVAIYFKSTQSLDLSRHAWLGWGENPASLDLDALSTAVHFGDILQQTPAHARRHNAEHQAILDEMGADLLFPIWRNDVLYGCLALRNNQKSGGFSASEVSKLARLLHSASALFQTFQTVQQIQDTHRRRGLEVMALGLCDQITPKLEAVQQYTTLIQDPALMPDERSLLTTSIQTDLHQITALMHAVNTVTRPQELSRLPIHIAEQLQQTIENTETAPVDIQVHCDIQIPTVSLSESALQEVWRALFANAIEATSNTIEVFVFIGTCTHDQRRGQPAIIVDVKDNGSGIPSTQLDAVTIPCFTTKPGHTGLGLSMVQHIMDAHNGEFSIQSVVDAGTTVTLRFPIDRG